MTLLFEHLIPALLDSIWSAAEARKPRSGSYTDVEGPEGEPLLAPDEAC